MANDNNIDGTINTTDSQIVASGLSLPAGFTNLRKPGELELLMTSGNNSNIIYSKNKYTPLDPHYKEPIANIYSDTSKTIYNNTSYNSVVQNSQRPIMQSAMGSVRSDFGMGLNDVVRITKWSVSGPGLLFAGKQLLLQGLNPYNETKLYNPLMPIVGTTHYATFGLVDSPTRFIEPSLGGVLGALGLGTISSIFGIGATPTPPKGTVGAGALSKNASDGGKGLQRGQTATNADKVFETKWGGSSGGGGLLSKIGNFFKANTALGTFLPITQPKNWDGTTPKYKIGERAYGLFLSNTDNGLFATSVKVDKSWEDSKKQPQNYTGGKDIGADNIQYGDVVYPTIKSDKEENSLLKNLTIDKYTSDTKRVYPTNFNDKTDQTVKDTNIALNSLLDSLHTVGGYSLFNDNAPYYAKNYKDLMSIKDGKNDIGKSPAKYSGTDVVAYSKFMVDNKQLLTRKGIDTYKADTINLMGIISASNFNRFDEKKQDSSKNDVYDPSQDDIIAFYFHDLVNDKYIPFRATVTGIQESLQSEWNEVKYINRADKIYTYGGFGRTVGFSFKVVITSIKELMPTWKRINYFTGLTKPSNYTEGVVYSRFIVPPLIEFTIGDMYKNQPAVITQIGISIPDDAIWETTSEDGKNRETPDKDVSQWTYLNGRIVWSNNYKGALGRYAQFPNSCDITVQMNLLEKEMPKTGGSNYGDYYLDITQNNETNPENNFSKNIYTQNLNKALTS